LGWKETAPLERDPVGRKPVGAKASAAAIAVRATVALMCHVEEDCEDMTKAQSFLLVTLPARFKWARPRVSFKVFWRLLVSGKEKRATLLSREREERGGR